MEDSPVAEHAVQYAKAEDEQAMEELKRQVDQKHQDVRLLKARFLVTVGENSSKHQVECAGGHAIIFRCIFSEQHWAADAAGPAVRDVHVEVPRFV